MHFNIFDKLFTYNQQWQATKFRVFDIQYVYVIGFLISFLDFRVASLQPKPMVQWYIISAILKREMPMNRLNKPPQVETIFVVVYISSLFNDTNSLSLNEIVKRVDTDDVFELSK